MIGVTETPVRQWAERPLSAMAGTPDADRRVRTRKERAAPVRRRFPQPTDPRLRQVCWPAPATHRDSVAALGVSPLR